MVFFFQAEDGIRDRDVTGVQTCALPICNASPRGLASVAKHCACCFISSAVTRPCSICARVDWRERSEERRVGEGGRSGWSTDHEEEEPSAQLGHALARATC